MTIKSFVKILQQRKMKLILISILAIFFVTALLIAINLKTNIIPDEAGHLLFSKHFSKTLDIPIDTQETAYWGWYVKQNHFLYYWINGRLINIFSFFHPQYSEFQILIFLRFVNVIYATSTVIFSYFISKEVIKDNILQILPPFFLSQTLMFVFL